MLNNTPAIYSIIVPVYNSATTLERCLESLVCQTYGFVKIIVVDKQSNDGSKEIESLYEKQYPDKVKVYHRPYSDNPAAARTYGIQVAETEYVAFCDADDYLDVTAFAKLNRYLEDSGKHYDVVCYGTYLTRDGDVVSVDRYVEPIRKEHLLMGKNCMGFWNKLFNRQLLLECGDVFDSTLDDIGHIPIVLSKAKTIGCLNTPLYYSELSGGISHQNDSPRCLDLLKSAEHVMECISARDLGAFCVCVATRVILHIKQHPSYEDIFIRWLQKNRGYFTSNAILKTQKATYSQIMSYIEKYEFWVPKRIYINGFEGINQEWSNNLCSNAFYGNDTELIILNKTNCSIEENPYAKAAYECGEYEFLAQWYALKNINEFGGLYISSHIQVGNYLTQLLKYKSFFSQIIPDSFSADLFGGCANAQIFSYLLETYQDGYYENRFALLDERLKNIFAVFYTSSPNEHGRMIGESYILDPTQVAVNTHNGNNLCSYQFHYDYNNEHLILIDNRILKGLSMQMGASSSQLYQLKTRCSRAERSLSEIQASDSYKLSLWFKKIGNMPIGYIPKKVFKKLLAIYRKFKRS